jgi:16S rRNA (guanine966-N2)-methyltransferase
VRIIGGAHKGRRINPPANLPVRPTTDLAKESLFNILNNLVDFTGLKVLDLFAGTGSISYEFASREAAIVTAIDLNYRCVAFIRKIAGSYDMKALKVVRSDVFRFLTRNCSDPYDLVFSDAPYGMEEITRLPGLVFENKWLKQGGLLIIEHPADVDFSNHPQFSQKRNYGRVNFSFFVNSG